MNYMNSNKAIKIVNKFLIPGNTRAVLWDMDGVIIDSLDFDVIVVNRLLEKYFGSLIKVSKQYLKMIFAYDPLTFWKMILQKVEKDSRFIASADQLKFLHEEYSHLRQTATFKLCPGILRIVIELNKRGIKQVVVSNNPTKEVKQILKRAGVLDKFFWICGNDVQVKGKMLPKKPSPAIYLFAMKKMAFVPFECVIVEDAEIGVRAGKAAGCFTIAVATGGATKNQLQKMFPKANKIYSSFS